MTSLEIALACFAILLTLIFLRVPIAAAMMLVGIGGSWFITGSSSMMLAQMKSLSYGTFSNHTLSIIPLFLLMGQFATLGGMSQSLFKAAEAWLGHRRGGLAMAAIGASAGFGAICGSSLATAATMGKVALPEMRKAGYSGALASGTLAAGGTLGILIPPSIILVIYAVLTEQNIAKLFVAALVPGLLAALGYMATIMVMVRVGDHAPQTRSRLNYRARFQSFFKIWPVLLIFLLVVGGIYSGLFNPTEAAAIGAIGTGLIAWMNGGLTSKNLADSLLETAKATAMIFLILLGASMFNTVLALSQLPQQASLWIEASALSPLIVLLLILLFYLVLGCVMDSLSMILLTVPILFPIIMALDFGLPPEHLALWFGILVLVVVEVGLITPPVGMNLFIINGMDRTIPISQTYRGVLPFIASDVMRIMLLVAFPSLTIMAVDMLFS